MVRFYHFSDRRFNEKNFIVISNFDKPSDKLEKKKLQFKAEVEI